MEVVYPSCCGIDVHAKSAVVCVVQKGKKQTRIYSTMNRQFV